MKLINLLLNKVILKICIVTYLLVHIALIVKCQSINPKIHYMKLGKVGNFYLYTLDSNDRRNKLLSISLIDKQYKNKLYENPNYIILNKEEVLSIKTKLNSNLFTTNKISFYRNKKGGFFDIKKSLNKKILLKDEFLTHKEIEELSRLLNLYIKQLYYDTL